MTEKLTIQDKEVWIEVDQHPVERANPNIIPTEYFTARYYLQDPSEKPQEGTVIEDEDGNPKLFESPVAALTYATKKFLPAGSLQLPI